MKSNKGITLVTLIVIVAVLIIIASVSIYTGISALNSTRLKGFYTQLEIVQKRVDEISANDEYYIDDENNKVYLSEQGSEVIGERLDKLKDIITSEGGDSTESYVKYFRYFTKEQVKTILGIEDIDYNLFINFDERIIIAEDGIQIGKKTYYMLQSATYFVKQSQKPTDDVDFTVEAEKLTDGYYKISILPTEPETTSTIKYKSIFTKYWERTNELEIKVTGDLPQYFDITYRSLSKKKSTTKCYGIYLDEEKNVQVTLVNKLYVESDLLSIETSNSTDETMPNEIFSYVLMNDITFTPSRYTSESPYYNKVYSDAYGYYWKPIGEVTIEKSGKFDGNNKEIHVTYTDSDGDDYTVTYNKENNYSEPEYEFNIITYVKDGESITKTEELGIEITIKNVTKDVNLDGTTVKVKRGAPNAIKVQAIPENQTTYKSSDEATIKAENPSKINKDVELEIEYRYVTVKFNVISSENGNANLNSKATLTLTINEISKGYEKSEFYDNGIKVIAGKEIKYIAECTGYETTDVLKYTPTADDNQIVTIDMNVKMISFMIDPLPYSEDEAINPTIKMGLTDGSLSVQDENTIKVQYGKRVYYEIILDNYESSRGAVEATEGEKSKGTVIYNEITRVYKYKIQMEPIWVSLTVKVKNVDSDGDALISGVTTEINGDIVETTGVEDGYTCYKKENIRAGTTVKYKVSADWYKTQEKTITMSSTDKTEPVTLKKNIVEYFVGPTGYGAYSSNVKNPEYAARNTAKPGHTLSLDFSGNRTTEGTYYTWLFETNEIEWPEFETGQILWSIDPVYAIYTIAPSSNKRPTVYARYKCGSGIYGECTFYSLYCSYHICLLFDSNPDADSDAYIEYDSMNLNQVGNLTLDALKKNGLEIYVEITTATGTSIGTTQYYYGASIRFKVWEKDYVETTSVSEETE